MAAAGQLADDGAYHYCGLQYTVYSTGVILNQYYGIHTVTVDCYPYCQSAALYIPHLPPFSPLNLFPKGDGEDLSPRDQGRSGQSNGGAGTR